MTTTGAIEAALLANFFYGVVLLLPAANRAGLGPDDALWVLATGGLGHAVHAASVADARAGRVLMLDIGLMCCALWLLIISAGEVADVAIAALRIVAGF